MYTPDEIHEDLDSGRLTLALYKMWRFARAGEFVELEQWANYELNGYPEGSIDPFDPEDIVRYRSTDVEWLDIYGRRATILPAFAPAETPPIWLGVSVMEAFLDEGMAYLNAGLTSLLSRYSTHPIRMGLLSAQSLRRLVNRITLEAKTRLDEVRLVDQASKETEEPQLPGTEPDISRDGLWSFKPVRSEGCSACASVQLP